jgi:transcriptional regulator with XRE-family HTH domain
VRPPGRGWRMESGMVSMFPDMLAEDRRRRGLTVGQVAWRLGVSPREYRELEAGTRSPTFET